MNLSFSPAPMSSNALSLAAGVSPSGEAGGEAWEPPQADANTASSSDALCPILMNVILSFLSVMSVRL
jgi:hypothetical protein